MWVSPSPESGGKTQLPAYRDVAGDLRLSYSQYKEVEVFARFGTQLDESTRHTLERGRRVQEVLKQRQAEPITAAEQVVVLLTLTEGLLDKVPVNQIQPVTDEVRAAVRRELGDICDKIESGEKLSEDDLNALLKVATETVASISEEVESPPSAESRKETEAGEDGDVDQNHQAQEDIQSHQEAESTQEEAET